MLKRLALTLTLTAGLTMIPTPATAKDQTICAFQSVDAGSWTTHENELTIRCFARKIGVDADTAVLIATRESGLNELAHNAYTDCRGLFQHLGRYWPSRVQTYARLLSRYDVRSTSAYNPRTNALVAVAMARSGWGPWS